MKNYLFPVIVTTAYLLIYIVSIHIPLNTGFVLFLFSISPLFIIWMVVGVLKAPVDVKYTFDEKWYEDE